MRQGDEVAGRYRLDELRGHGPMSEVWRAHDDTLDRTVALKILSPTADLDRFRREAKAVAALAHENVMRVYDYGEDEAGPFMAFEWLPGGTLEDRLGRGQLAADETRRVAAGIAAGLAHLHARGLVHRDLKPANVLFDEEGRPKVGDFGLARRTAGAGTLTEAGTVLGTAAYLSPEQAAGEPAGPASDVYSFGVILFRMLTGALPFVADEPLALLNMHRHEPAPAVEALQPDAPRDLAALAAAALRKDPARRPPDGSALLTALGEAPATRVVPAETAVTRVLPVAEAQAQRRPLWREPAAIAAAVVLLAAAGGVLAWAVTRPGSSAPASGPSTGHTHRPTTSTAPTTSAASSQVSTTSPTTTRGTTTQGTTTQPATTTQTTATLPTTAPTTVPTTTLPTTVPTTTSGLGTTTTIGTT